MAVLPGRPGLPGLSGLLVLGWLPSMLAAAAVSAAGPVGSRVEGPAPASTVVAAEYTSDLVGAVSDLVVADEERTGYTRTSFRHWVDADGDGCSTRVEVLLSEADDPATVTRTCRVRGGRWYSYYDGRSWTDARQLDVDHLVALGEAWDSGARAWTPESRELFANDLGDTRVLVAVTASVNRAKSDRDPATWLPDRARCRYVREWVAVKHRWELTVDPGELDALEAVVAGCPAATVSVILAEPESTALERRGRIAVPQEPVTSGVPPWVEGPRADRVRKPRSAPKKPERRRERPTNRPQDTRASAPPQDVDDCRDTS